MKLTLLSFSVLVAIAGCATSSEDATSGDESDVTALSTAFSQSCTLAKLEDDGVFEESLSKEEYPDVSVERDGKTGEVTVSIGDSV